MHRHAALAGRLGGYPYSWPMAADYLRPIRHDSLSIGRQGHIWPNGLELKIIERDLSRAR